MAITSIKGLPPDDEHPAADGTRRFPIDAFLRRAGFHIISRASGKEPIWGRNGKHYTQREAVRLVKEEKRT